MRKLVKQGVALTGHNTTGPPRSAPGELRCICDCYRRRQTPATVTSLALLHCVCLSVRLSQAGVLSKGLNVSSRKRRHGQVHMTALNFGKKLTVSWKRYQCEDIVTVENIGNHKSPIEWHAYQCP